jgi:hypothetical protein
LPVDVEPAGEGRTGTAAEDVGPCAVSEITDAHVVGDEIEEQSEFVLPEGADENLKSGGAAEIGVEPIEVADVIAMGARGARCEDGRCVDVTDPKMGEVTKDGRGALEGELVMELESVGGAKRG